MLNYFNWTEISLITNDTTYLTNLINWEDSTFLMLSDPFTFFNLCYSHYVSTYWTFLTFKPTSILTWFFSKTTDLNFLYNAFFLDLFNEGFNFFLINFSFSGINFLERCTYQPEVTLFFNELVNNYSKTVIFNVSSIYDSFVFNNTSLFMLDYFVYYTWLALTIFIFLFLLNVLNFFNLSNGIVSNFFLNRMVLFANHFAFENRLQLDWTLLSTFFILLVWIPLLITYDDVNVEVVELTHFFICAFFAFIIVFLLLKYSIHFFSFLENTVVDGYSTVYIAKQFVRDVSNTFALFLRFFLLLFRLNIYDGLDDFLDSYYIFFIDFDEDSYRDELLLPFNFNFYFNDNREDVIFYNSVEFGWWEDLYSKFFIIFGKFFFFWALILEEIFRVSLALYISYLIIFEVHAVNISNNEDFFFGNKK